MLDQIRKQIKPRRVAPMSDRVALYPFMRKQEDGTLEAIVTSDNMVECRVPRSLFTFVVPQVQFATLHLKPDTRGMSFASVFASGTARFTDSVDGRGQLIQWVDVSKVIDLDPAPITNSEPAPVTESATAPVTEQPAVTAAAPGRPSF
jgi:hypothetical protein